MLHRGRVPLYDKETGELPAASLCPTMDLIAFASPNSSTVAVYRSIDWERLQSVALGGGGHCSGTLAWRSDGKVLAVGMDQGQVCLVSMESRKATEDGGEEEEEELVCVHGEGEITALSWSQFPLGTDNNEWLEELQRESHAVVRHVRPQYSTRLTDNVAILNSLTAGGSSSMKEEEGEETNGREELRKEVDVLVVGDEQGKVSLQLFGRFPIGELELGMPIIQVLLSCSGNGLLLLALTQGNVLHTYNAGHVQRHLPLLSLVCETFQEIAKEFAQTKRVLSIAQRAWEDLILGMKKLLSPLIQHDASQTFGEFLYSLLTMGPTYPEQVQLFTTLSIGQLQRIRRQIEQTMLVLIKLFEIEVTQSVESVLFRLGQLLGVDLREVGVSLGWKNSVVNACQQLLVHTHRCARMAKETEGDLLALVGFLRSSFARYRNSDEEDQGLDDQEVFSRVHQFLHINNGLEKPPLSRQLGLKKTNVFSIQQLKQSWDRDFVEEDEEDEEEEIAVGGKGLFALVETISAEWKMSQQLISQALSKTLVRMKEPQIVEGEEVVLHGNSLAYHSEGELVVETWTTGTWSRQSLPGVEPAQLAYCGSTPGKPAALEQGLFLGALGGNQIAVVGWGENGELAVVKTVPAQTKHLARIAASGPRGVCFAVSHRGRFQMLDLMAEED